MNEKIKIIIGIILFIIIMIGITIIVNKKNNLQKPLNNSELSNVDKDIIEVNDNNFETEVINSNKKVLVDFYATWCMPCKSLKPTIEQIANENKDLKVVEIDVDKCESLVLKYNIQAMPTLVVIENGEEVNRIVGAVPKKNILKLCGIE